MTFKDAAHRMGWARAALGAMLLAGCASAPPKVAPAPVAPPPPPPAIVTMAPIPNPQATPAHERRAASHSRSATTAAKREHASAPTPSPTSASVPSKPTLNPTRAAQLRARGLEELNRGAVGQAVALLTQARQLDPTNPTIRHDLERAERIARTVHGQH